MSCLLIGQFEFDFICITIGTNKRQLKAHSNQMTQGADRVVPGVPRVPRGTNTESVVPKTDRVVPVEYWGAERLTDTEWYQHIVVPKTDHVVPVEY